MSILDDKALVVDTVAALEMVLATYEDSGNEALLQALDLALCLARGKAGSNGGATNRRSHNINWNATGERRLLKCMLNVLVRTGMARNALLAKFKYLVPNFQAHFDHPVSDSAIWGRADTGRRDGKYLDENPDRHPLTQPYWGTAKVLVEANVPLTVEDIRAWARRAEAIAETEDEADDADDEGVICNDPIFDDPPEPQATTDAEPALGEDNPTTEGASS
jgi:hypothetical protein